MTDAEQKLWYALRAKRFEQIKFKRQKPIGPYIVDFVAPSQKIVIELDGGQHGEQQAYDAKRTAYLQTLGFCVLRFWNDEYLQQSEAVLEKIAACLQERS